MRLRKIAYVATVIILAALLVIAITLGRAYGVGAAHCESDVCVEIRFHTKNTPDTCTMHVDGVLIWHRNPDDLEDDGDAIAVTAIAAYSGNGDRLGARNHFGIPKDADGSVDHYWDPAGRWDVQRITVYLTGTERDNGSPDDPINIAHTFGPYGCPLP